MNNLLKKKKDVKTKIIINIEEDLKRDFKNICDKNNLKMTEVLVFAISQINEKGDLYISNEANTKEANILIFYPH